MASRPKTKEEKIQLLNETVDFFKVNPRCIQQERCKYYAEGLPGCAIGRLIPDKDLCARFDRVAFSVGDIRIFQFLPEDLKEYGVSFLDILQQLHDRDHHWIDRYSLSSAARTGRDLSDDGFEFVRVAAERIARGEV